MRKVLVFHDQFWSNTGGAAVGTISSGSNNWFVPGGTTLSAGGSGSWRRYELGAVGGVDELYVQFRSVVVAVGGITVTASGVINCACMGQIFTEEGSLINNPPSQDEDPAELFNDTWKRGDVLWTASNTLASDAQEASAQPAVRVGGLFGNQAAFATGTYGWSFRIIPKPVLGTVAVGGNLVSADLLQSLAQYQRLYLAMASFITYTGTLLTTQVIASMRVLGYRWVTETTQAPDGGRRITAIAPF